LLFSQFFAKSGFFTFFIVNFLMFLAKSGKIDVFRDFAQFWSVFGFLWVFRSFSYLFLSLNSNKYELWYYSFKVLVQLHYLIGLIVSNCGQGLLWPAISYLLASLLLIVSFHHIWDLHDCKG
jgi:hypothetical protein